VKGSRREVFEALKKKKREKRSKNEKSKSVVRCYISFLLLCDCIIYSTPLFFL
jgi:hypothetical protein